MSQNQNMTSALWEVQLQWDGLEGKGEAFLLWLAKQEGLLKEVGLEKPPKAGLILNGKRTM